MALINLFSLRREGPRSSLSLLDYTLLTVGSLFTVGVAEEECDTVSMPVMVATEFSQPQAPRHSRVLITSPVIQPTREMAPTPELKPPLIFISQVTSQMIFMSQVMSPLIFMSQVMSPLIFMSQVMSPLIFMSQVMSPLIFMSQVMSPLIFMSQVMSPLIFMSQVMSPLIFMSQSHVMSLLIV
uniref:Uncharacterized protein n=1 Tax=Sinocyclocheilus grahami TaxID=75366 RepID=A0A672MH10_SINGR